MIVEERVTLLCRPGQGAQLGSPLAEFCLVVQVVVTLPGLRVGPPRLPVPSVKPDIGQRCRRLHDRRRQVWQARLVHAAVGHSECAEKVEGLVRGPALVTEFHHEGVSRQLSGDSPDEVGVFGCRLEGKGELEQDTGQGAGLSQRLDRLAERREGVTHFLPGVGHILVPLDRKLQPPLCPLGHGRHVPRRRDVVVGRVDLHGGEMPGVEFQHSLLGQPLRIERPPPLRVAESARADLDHRHPPHEGTPLIK